MTIKTYGHLSLNNTSPKTNHEKPSKLPKLIKWVTQTCKCQKFTGNLEKTTRSTDCGSRKRMCRQPQYYKSEVLSSTNTKGVRSIIAQMDCFQKVNRLFFGVALIFSCLGGLSSLTAIHDRLDSLKTLEQSSLSTVPKLRGQQVHRQQLETSQKEEEAVAAGAPFPTEPSELARSLDFLWSQLVGQSQASVDPLSATLPSTTLVNIKLRQRSTFPAASYEHTENDDVVLATHGSVAKLDVLLTQLEYWNGPASVALFMDDGPTQIPLLDSFLQEYENQLVNASFHLYMEHAPNTVDSFYTVGEESTESESTLPPVSLGYPHNILRNLAMENCGSNYFVALDVDFIPSPRNAYSRLLATLWANNGTVARYMQQERRVMVLPAFEVFARKGETIATADQLPTNKSMLEEMVNSKQAQSFKHDKARANHAPTVFGKWFQTPQLDETVLWDMVYNNATKSNQSTNSIVTKGKKKKKSPDLYYPITYKPRFEPYVLAYKPGIPRYWTAYRGFGRNKVSWFSELARAGYQYATLTQVYLVHLDHPNTFNRQQLDRNKLQDPAFYEYLENRYPAPVLTTTSSSRVTQPVAQTQPVTTTSEPEQSVSDLAPAAETISAAIPLTTETITVSQTESNVVSETPSAAIAVSPETMNSETFSDQASSSSTSTLLDISQQKSLDSNAASTLTTQTAVASDTTTVTAQPAVATTKPRSSLPSNPTLKSQSLYSKYLQSRENAVIHVRSKQKMQNVQ